MKRHNVSTSPRSFSWEKVKYKISLNMLQADKNVTRVSQTLKCDKIVSDNIILSEKILRS